MERISNKEKRNMKRANRAGSALRHYQKNGRKACGPVGEEDLIDLLTDLRHAAAKYSWDFDAAARISEGHYAEEV
jgi:hypothetical protein